MRWIEQLKHLGEPSGAPVRKKSGTKPKLPWDDYYEAFANKCDKDDFPDDTNVNGWNKQADVERWIIDTAERQDKVEIKEATARRHASAFMSRYKKAHS